VVTESTPIEGLDNSETPFTTPELSTVTEAALQALLVVV